MLTVGSHEVKTLADRVAALPQLTALMESADNARAAGDLAAAVRAALAGVHGAYGIAAADVEDNLTYQGNKARITVGKIKDKADGCSWQEAEAVGEMLSTALANDPKFIVLASGEEVDELIDEIDLGKSGYVEDGRERSAWNPASHGG